MKAARRVMWLGGAAIVVIVLLIADSNGAAAIGFGLGAVNGMALVALAVGVARAQGWK